MAEITVPEELREELALTTVSLSKLNSSWPESGFGMMLRENLPQSVVAKLVDLDSIGKSLDLAFKYDPNVDDRLDDAKFTVVSDRKIGGAQIEIRLSDDRSRVSWMRLAFDRPLTGTLTAERIRQAAEEAKHHAEYFCRDDHAEVRGLLMSAYFGLDLLSRLSEDLAQVVTDSGDSSGGGSASIPR